MWTDGPIKWQRCASAWTRSAAGRFALIKASRRFLCSSRGPLDVKRLKAGSRGRRMAQKHKCEDRTFYELDDSEDDRVFSVWTNNDNVFVLFCFVFFNFPQSEEMRRPRNKHRETTKTKGRDWQALVHQRLTEFRITTGSEVEAAKSNQSWHKQQKGFIRGRVIDRGCNTQLDLCSFVLR